MLVIVFLVVDHILYTMYMSNVHQFQFTCLRNNNSFLNLTIQCKYSGNNTVRAWVCGNYSSIQGNLRTRDIINLAVLSLVEGKVVLCREVLDIILKL